MQIPSQAQAGFFMDKIERVYKSVNEIMFCPACHQRVELPFKGGMNILGTMRIACGKCKRGLIVIEGKKEKKKVN